jgi:hypothetical protein
MGERPLLFTAAGCGDRVAAHVRQLVRGWPHATAAAGAVESEAAPVLRGAVATAWAALQLLPHSCDQWQEVKPTSQPVGPSFSFMSRNLSDK